jgi:hypothetical protein
LLSTFADEPTLVDEAMGTCTFQFWVDRIESFYCKLDKCSWQLGSTASEWSPRSELGDQAKYQLTNETRYNCEVIECACVPGRFLCGEDGSVSK